MTDGAMTLQEVAAELGVHYMTVYRYVRLGELVAHKVGGGWRVQRDALDAFRANRDTPPAGRRHRAPWNDRLESRLLAGDAAGAWGVIEAAMAGGATVAEIYLDVLSPAMRSMGERWRRGEIGIEIEHRASGIIARLIGRLGPRGARPGRSRGSIVLGSPAGEQHGLVVAMLSDLLRFEGWEVSDLGADTPRESIVAAAKITDDLVAVGLSVMNPDHLDECEAVCASIRNAGIGVPILVGGLAVRDREHARALGADDYATDGRALCSALSHINARVS